MAVVNLASVFLRLFEMGVHELCEGMRLEKKNDWPRRPARTKKKGASQ
jgi:hypothetical protein